MDNGEISFGVGYTTPLGDWILMKIFATREAAEEDLPKWGNGIVPNARFDVRDISQDMLIAAVNSGCLRAPHPENQPRQRVSKQNRILELERWIATEGERTDTCTHSILGRICKGCRCWRSTGGTGSKSKLSTQSMNGPTEKALRRKIG